MKKEELHSYNLRRLKAEQVLTAFYSDTDRVAARNKGAFYRRYSPDLMEVEDGEVWLSRDGILQSLPQEFLSSPGALSGGFKEGYEQQQARLSVLEDAFMPFDTFFFREYIRAQRQADKVLNEKTTLVLKEFFDYDIEQENNPYIKQLAVLLPFVQTLRGKPERVRCLLEAVFGERVTCKTYLYSEDDTTRGALPKTIFTIWKEGLSVDDYAVLAAEVKETERFAAHWFMPFDHKTEIEIRNRETAGNEILDYNTLIG